MGGSQWPPYSMWYHVAAILSVWVLWKTRGGGWYTEHHWKGAGVVSVPACQTRLYRPAWHCGVTPDGPEGEYGQCSQ